jgi:uncharacterized membrane protein
MAPVVAVHLAAALLALVVGAVVVARRKGTRPHKAWGRLWVALILTTAITSLWIPAFLHFSWIHILTAITLVSVASALWAIRHGNIAGHRGAMIGTYLGLVGAFIGALAPGRIVGSFVWRLLAS